MDVAVCIEIDGRSGLAHPAGMPSTGAFSSCTQIKNMLGATAAASPRAARRYLRGSGARRGTLTQQGSCHGGSVHGAQCSQLPQLQQRSAAAEPDQRAWPLGIPGGQAAPQAARRTAAAVREGPAVTRAARPCTRACSRPAPRVPNWRRSWRQDAAFLSVRSKGMPMKSECSFSSEPESSPV